MRITLSSIHQRQGRDGLSFDAVLKVDGRRVGMVDNDGNGGCNRYHFDVTPNGKRVTSPTFTDEMGERMRANKAAFEAAAREDAATLGLSTDGFEWEDTLISDLMAELEFGKIAKRDGKKGFPVTAVFLDGFNAGDSEVMGRPTFDTASTLALRDVKPATLQALTTRYPESRIVLYMGDSGERITVLQEAPAAQRWLDARAAQPA